MEPAARHRLPRRWCLRGRGLRTLSLRWRRLNVTSGRGTLRLSRNLRRRRRLPPGRHAASHNHPYRE